MRLLPIALLLLAGAWPATAQSPGTAHGRFVTGVSADGATFTVTVQLRAEPGDRGLGTSTVQFTFDDAALVYAEGAYLNYDGTQATYTGGTATYTSTITQPNPDEVSLNVELAGSTDGNGQALPSTFTDVATLTFDITDPAATAALQWDTRALFAGPGGTAYTLGTFESDDTSLPVELVAFEAALDGGAVVLAWTTASETGNAGFEVQTAAVPDAEAARDWRALGFVEGHGTTAEARHYGFRAVGLWPGRHAFRLRQVDLDGTARYGPELEVTVAVPRTLALEPPAPNPFREATHLRFTVPTDGPAEVALYDVLGRRLRTLYAGRAEAGGAHAVRLEADGLAAGVYVLRLRFEDRAQTRRVLLVR